MKRILIAGTGSGTGKTTFVSGLLYALKKRGEDPVAFKCGPDYIDPMFHRKVLGIPGGNLDLFFQSEENLRKIFAATGGKHGISVIEGVMGYYDGLGFSTTASSYHVGKTLETPAILLINCKGMSQSILAVLEGFLKYQENSQIKGVIFNMLPESLYDAVAEKARDLGITPLGFLPRKECFALESRHLGLVKADEITDFKERIEVVAQEIEKYVDVEELLRIAAQAPEIEVEKEPFVRTITHTEPVIAVAKDAAFCFLYEENLTFLKEAGAKVEFFSPLTDTTLPEGTAGIYLSGGYPELYAKQLEENTAMRQELKKHIQEGMPCMAECGGFLYLHRRLEGEDGQFYKMAGVVEADGVRTPRLGRFGYIYLTPRHEGLFEKRDTPFTAHEFHYWKSTEETKDFQVEKPGKKREWQDGILTDTLYAGFPHFYFYGNPEVGTGLVKAAARFAGKEDKENEQ